MVGTQLLAKGKTGVACMFAFVAEEDKVMLTFVVHDVKGRTEVGGDDVRHFELMKLTMVTGGAELSVGEMGRRRQGWDGPMWAREERGHEGILGQIGLGRVVEMVFSFFFSFFNMNMCIHISKCGINPY